MQVHFTIALLLAIKLAKGERREVKGEKRKVRREIEEKSKR